jgi:hypothetical protein
MKFSFDSFDAIENIFGGNEPAEQSPVDLNSSAAIEDLDKAQCHPNFSSESLKEQSDLIKQIENSGKHSAFFNSTSMHKEGVYYLDSEINIRIVQKKWYNVSLN